MKSLYNMMAAVRSRRSPPSPSHSLVHIVVGTQHPLEINSRLISTIRMELINIEERRVGNTILFG